MLRIEGAEAVRWAAMTPQVQAGYNAMAEYLAATYNSLSVTLADVEAAWATGA